MNHKTDMRIVRLRDRCHMYEQLFLQLRSYLNPVSMPDALRANIIFVISLYSVYWLMSRGWYISLLLSALFTLCILHTTLPVLNRYMTPVNMTDNLFLQMTYHDVIEMVEQVEHVFNYFRFVVHALIAVAAMAFLVFINVPDSVVECTFVYGFILTRMFYWNQKVPYQTDKNANRYVEEYSSDEIIESTSKEGLSETEDILTSDESLSSVLAANWKAKPSIGQQREEISYCFL